MIRLVSYPLDLEIVFSTKPAMNPKDGLVSKRKYINIAKYCNSTTFNNVDLLQSK